MKTRSPTDNFLREFPGDPLISAEENSTRHFSDHKTQMSTSNVLAAASDAASPNTIPGLPVCAVGEERRVHQSSTRKRKRQTGPRPPKKQREGWTPTTKNKKDPTVSTLPYKWSLVKVAGRRKFRQVKAECGHASLNNAFGDADEEIVELDLLHTTADKLNSEEPVPPPESMKKKTLYGDKSGNFHVKTMQLACKASGYKMEKQVDVHGRYPSHMELPNLKAQGRYVGLGYTGRGNDTHWFAVDTDNGLVIDSATKGFIKLDSAGILKAVSWGISKLYKITKL
jgi:hypothetical protein